MADADPFNLRLLQEVCEAGGHRVITSGDGTEVLDVVARERPHLILLDAAIPGLDGHEVLRILKADDVMSTIPVLMVTAAEDVDGRRRAIELGAEDYVSKPYLVFEVQQRIRNTLRALREGRQSDGESDLLVGTAQQLGISLEYELTRAVRYHHSLACIVLRVGNHQQLVETAGGRWQRAIGAVLCACVRATDQVYISGGDEFVILLPETGVQGAQVVLDRVRLRLEHGIESVPVSPVVAGGFAVYPDATVDDGVTLLSMARRALMDS